MSTTESAVKKPDTMIIDIGKQRRKRVRQLRRGEGPLAEQVEALLDEMRADGRIEASAQAVVIVVQQKPKKPDLRFW